MQGQQELGIKEQGLGTKQRNWGKIVIDQNVITKLRKDQGPMNKTFTMINVHAFRAIWIKERKNAIQQKDPGMGGKNLGSIMSKKKWFHEKSIVIWNCLDKGILERGSIRQQYAIPQKADAINI